MFFIFLFRESVSTTVLMSESSVGIGQFAKVEDGLESR